MNLKKILIVTALSLATFAINAQLDSTKTNDEFNFEEFGDADNKVIKNYCTSKVNYLSPTKLISVGYEAQNTFDITGPSQKGSASIAGFKLGLNAPVISRSNIIVNLGLNYWNSGINYKTEPINNLFRNTNALNSLGLNTTIFKPLNNKNFIIFQASGDINGNYTTISNIDTKGLTVSSTLVYGWKKDDNQMFGVGLTRTYRAGALLHIPVIFYNKTFNKKWGIESFFPGRAHVRRNFSPSSYLMLGYELEGNSYYINRVVGSNQDLYLRRGELKPRIMFEKKLAGFIYLSAQTGLRINYRFEGFATKNPVKDEIPLFPIAGNKTSNPLYFNISINLVSP